VFSFLKDMPTIDDISDNVKVNRWDDDIEIEFDATGRAKEGISLLNFDTYRENNTPTGFEALPISSEYNCSREGCLAGWYVFIMEDQGRGEEVEGLQIGYSTIGLAKHFGILNGEAHMLFGTLLQGAEGVPDDIAQEDTLWSVSQLNATTLALEEREIYLGHLIRRCQAQALAPST
jgi:hypothetical protein